MSLIAEYFELTKKYQEEYGPNTILLMQVGAFFEVYGKFDVEQQIIVSSKITDFSQICELNIVDKNTCVGKHNVVMAGFKDVMIEKYLRKIQDAGFTAVVYTQDENAKNTSRSLAGIFSPGTYFQPDSPNLTNSITCIWVQLVDNKVLLKGKYVVVGVANIDIYTGKTTLFQFKETYANNPTTYDELERFISVYNPSEVLLITNLPNEREMDAIINYAGIGSSLVHKIHVCDDNTYTTRVKNCEKQPYQKEVLSTFYQIDHFDVFLQNFYENHIATQAFCFLLDFVYQHNPQLVHKIAEPVFDNGTDRLTLANHSLKQLNIINDGTVKSSKLSSVADLLNHCLTPMGRRQFTNHLLNPICNAIALTREYTITDHLLQPSNVSFCGQLKTKLALVKDLAKFERQLFLKKITPKSVFTLHSSINEIRGIFALAQQDTTLMEYLSHFDPMVHQVGEICHTLTAFIEKHVDLALAKDLDQLQQFDVNFIRAGVDLELDNKTFTLEESEAKLESVRECLCRLIEQKEKKTAKDYVKIHETDKNNYSLISTARRCKLLQEALSPKEHIETLYTSKGVTFPLNLAKSRFSFEKQSASNNYIVNDWVKNLCNSISSSKLSMKDLICVVYNRFIEQVSGFQDQLECIIQFVTRIDVLYAKAHIARQYNYCKPVIVDNADKAFVDAKGLRHCLIERFQLEELYVTNDVVLGNGATDGILLYGTNAVGKTTLIRALGIAVIMAQAGLYVPCSSFQFHPYKQLFTRIIGNDNIFKGLSTFEVEMSELRTILRLMDKNSLVLGDELCSGTETVSATSIFVAGIQKLHACNSSFIFATHLHEIVDYDEIVSLQNVHLKHMEVKYDREKDMLVYDRKLKDGSGTSLYGLEVCKSLNLPNDFLEMANDIRLKYNPDGRSLLSLKQSRYNAGKLMSTCEQCGKHAGTEVHHLQHQADADERGIITADNSVFHKNNLANLMTLCESCHDELHKTNVKQKRVKTSKGAVLSVV